MAQLLTFTLLLLSSIVGMTYIKTACGDEPLLKITTKRDSDKVEFKVEEDKAVISVRSPFGISQAVVERNGIDWPSSVTLRLYLNGLENFKATVGRITLEAAVASQDGKVRLWKDGREDAPLESKNPYWMEIRMIGKDGKPAQVIPLKGGYFELRLPKAVFEDNPKLITLNWIDFYR